ncbi:hypothetical protein LguiA_005949 [Lonicera macranthoides]
MGKAKEFGTPRKKQKSSHPTTFVRRSPRLMEKFKLPFSCSSTDPVSLSDDEVEIDLPRNESYVNESPVRDETMDFPRVESPNRVETMDLVDMGREYVSTEKETQNQFTMHDFDIIFPMSELINSGFSQLSSSRDSQLINTGVEGDGPSAGVDFPLAIESPYKIPGLDNIDAEEEYHSGLESDKVSDCGSLSFSESGCESEDSGFEKWDWGRYESEEAVDNNGEERDGEESERDTGETENIGVETERDGEETERDDRTPRDSHMGTFYGGGSFEDAGDCSGKITSGIQRNSSYQPMSCYQPEESHSLISFKPEFDNFGHASGALLSFDQNDHYSILDSPREFANTRLLENFNCIQRATGISDVHMVEDAFGWLNPEETATIDGIQEVETEEACFHKRPQTGESIQALKKQCTSGTKKAKQKSTQSKDPQSVAAKNRRERISERLKILQDLVPNGSKVDLVTMLEKAISYVKFLQLQVKVLATDELWPVQGGKAPELSQVKEAIDAILASQRDRNSSSK